MKLDEAKLRAEALALELISVPPELQMERLQTALKQEPKELRDILMMYVYMARSAPSNPVHLEISGLEDKAPGADGRYTLERVAATLSGVTIVGLVCFLLIRNEPIADPRLFYALRVFASLAVAVLGATLPGFLSVGWDKNGTAIRAGGALALFALTYWFTPDLVQ